MIPIRTEGHGGGARLAAIVQRRRSIGPVSAILVAGVLSLPFVAMSVVDAAGFRVLWDNLAWAVASIGASVATTWSVRGTTGRRRAVRTAGAVALVLWMVGNLLWAWLSLVGAATFPSIVDPFVISIVFPATFVLVASVHGLVTRAEEAAIYLDSVLGLIVVGTALLVVNGATDVSLPPVASFLAIIYPTSLLGLGAAGMIGVLSIGYPVAPRGATALLFGSALLGVAYVGWVAPTARGVAVDAGPSVLFTVGTLIAGYGLATWSDQRSTSASYLAGARRATRLVGPGAAAILLVLLLFPTPASVEPLVRVAVVIGGALFVIREALLLQERTTMLATVSDLTVENVRLVGELRSELERRSVDERRMIATSRAAAVGDLAAGVAHEVNNPLTGILGFAELLIEGMDPDDPRRSDVETIRSQAIRARDIVRALRDVAEPPAPRLALTDLSALIHHTVGLVRYSIERRGTTIWEDLPSLPPILLDASAIQQAILNILTNARQATSEGGRIEVSSRVEGDDRVIAIADDGIGMDELTKGLAFDPFFTGRDIPAPEPGRGLGLSISNGLIESHGGTITINSRPGHGTTVEIRLPRPRSADPVGGRGSIA